MNSSQRSPGGMTDGTSPEHEADIARLSADSGPGEAFKPPTVSVDMPRDGQTRFLVRRSGPGGFLVPVGTDVLSPPGKLLMSRLAMDVMRRRRRLANDKSSRAAARLDAESIVSYALRRLGQQILDHVLDPVLRAICMEDAAPMSVVDFFLALTKFDSGPTRYPIGSDFLARHLPTFGDVHTGATVRDVRHLDGGVRAVWRDSESDHVIITRAAVLAPHGPDLMQVCHDLSGRRRRELIKSVRYRNAVGGVFAPRRLSADAPAILPAPGADPDLAMTAADRPVPDSPMPDSVPPGKALTAGRRADDHSKKALDDELLSEIISHIETVISGYSAELEFHVIRWGFATNAQCRGFCDTLAKDRGTLVPGDVIELAGKYLALHGTTNSVENGERAASNPGERLRSPYGPRAERQALPAGERALME